MDIEAGEKLKTQGQSTMEEVIDHEEIEGDAAEKQDQAEALRAGLASTSSDIKDLKSGLCNKLITFKEDLKRDMRKEAMIKIWPGLLLQI